VMLAPADRTAKRRDAAKSAQEAGAPVHFSDARARRLDTRPPADRVAVRA